MLSCLKGGKMFKSVMSLLIPGWFPKEERIYYHQSTGKCPLQRDLLVPSPFVRVWQLFIKFWHLAIFMLQLPCLSETLLLTRGTAGHRFCKIPALLVGFFYRKFSDSCKNKFFWLWSVLTFLTESKGLIWRRRFERLEIHLHTIASWSQERIKQQGMKPIMLYLPC